MSNNRVAWAVLAAVALAFTWGVVRLYDLRLASGDVYPVYSSFRADPLGTKALFESIAELPQYSAQRNFRDFDDFREQSGTLLWIGEDPFTFVLRPEAELEQLEKIASHGVRLVIAMTPVKRASAQMEVKESALDKRWGVTFVYVRRVAADSEDKEGPLPKQTALVMKSGGQVMPVIEKQFGKGAVVLVDSAYPFSNEALATDRNTALLLGAIGSNRTVIFDEHHLGLSETSSVVMLARKYRLLGLGAGLLILAALFIWRNSSPLLPARRPVGAGEMPSGASGQQASALHHLLRRNIPEPQLMAACVAEWEKSGCGGRSCSAEKLNSIRQLSKGTGKPLEVYRKLQSVATRRD